MAAAARASGDRRADRGRRHLYFLLHCGAAVPCAEAFATILYPASLMGIIAIAVGLLMIGGEFDLSAGVAVITSP